MGLSIRLLDSGQQDPEGNELYWRNITHNLVRMASEAGLYACLWRAEENGYVKAADLIAPLTQGLDRLKAEPDRFSQFNAANGWGTYPNFVLFVESVLGACRKHPQAIVETSV